MTTSVLGPTAAPTSDLQHGKNAVGGMLNSKVRVSASRDPAYLTVHAPKFAARSVALRGSAPAATTEITASAPLIYVAPRGAPVETVSSAYVSNYLFSLQKRTFDIAGAMLLICLSLPVLILIACLIKATSRGPVLFKQKRNGAAGKAFTVFKFRSMTQASCLEQRVLQATRGDARITLVGRFIRRTSIDELPQLINVLKGEMSLIGPRPHAIEHDVFYSAKIPLYSWRFVARPGLSGLAQVNGARGETRQISDMERRVILDVEYIHKASLLHDMRIVLATCREMLFSSSAY